MAYTIKKVDVWAGEVADRPGGLASTLAAMQSAGSNIEFVVARRAPDKPGTGVIFLTPVKGSKQKTAAQQAGLGTSESLHSVRVEGPDRAGLGAKMADALAAAGINLRSRMTRRLLGNHFSQPRARYARSARRDNTTPRIRKLRRPTSARRRSLACLIKS